MGDLRKAVSLTGEDGLIECLYCGHRARFLVPHLRHVHGVTAAEYRVEHHLPATASMHADSTRYRMQERQRALLADDPTALDHLKPYQTREHTSELGRRAADRVRASHDIPLAREHRLPGQRRAVSAMVEARLAKLTVAVREHGYDSVDAAVDATRDMPAKAAARATGLSPQTITRRRAAQE